MLLMLSCHHYEIIKAPRNMHSGQGGYVLGCNPRQIGSTPVLCSNKAPTAIFLENTIELKKESPEVWRLIRTDRSKQIGDCGFNRIFGVLQNFN